MEKHSFAAPIGEIDVLYFENGIYRHGGNLLVEKEVEELYPQALSRDRTETLGKIIANTRRSQSDFDRNPLSFNFLNGIYNVKTEKYHKHGTKPRLDRIQFPVLYRPKARCPFIMQTIAEWQPEEKQQERLLDQAAYALMKQSLIPKVFFHHGRGHNGKDKFFSLIRAMLGERNYTAVSLHSIIKDKFSIAQLNGKLASFSGETTNLPFSEATMLKDLTSGSPLQGQHKHGHPFDFINRAKLFFAVNNLPFIADHSDGFYRRLELMEWKEEFSKRDDRDLERKLTTPMNLSGFLNMLLPRMRRIESTKKLRWESTAEEARRDWDAAVALDGIDQLSYEKDLRNSRGYAGRGVI